MSKLPSRTIYILSVLLLYVLLGGPQLAQAWPMPQQSQSSQQGVTTNTGTTQPPAQTYPDAPSTQQNQQQPSTKQKEQVPLGAAAAEAGATAGGAASRPAGSAIAPAKQGQKRSFLIKLGLIAAGGAAIGVVYALSRGTSSVPPGSGR